MADDTYPVNPLLTTITNASEVNSTNWNLIQANLNAIGLDLVNARGDGQDFPGVDNTADQSTNIDDALQAIRYKISEISLTTNWYDVPARTIELQPPYPGGVWTASRHGAAPSGANTGTQSNGESIVANVARHYYEFTSSEVALQDYRVALRWTLPADFVAWKSGVCLTIDYQTEDADFNNCEVAFDIYQSGSGAVVGNNANTSTTWTTMTFTDTNISGWVWEAGDILELYFKLSTKDDYYARVGKVRLQYTS